MVFFSGFGSLNEPIWCFQIVLGEMETVGKGQMMVGLECEGVEGQNGAVSSMHMVTRWK